MYIYIIQPFPYFQFPPPLKFPSRIPPTPNWISGSNIEKSNKKSINVSALLLVQFCPNKNIFSILISRNQLFRRIITSNLNYCRVVKVNLFLFVHRNKKYGQVLLNTTWFMALKLINFSTVQWGHFLQKYICLFNLNIFAFLLQMHFFRVFKASISRIVVNPFNQ